LTKRYEVKCDEYVQEQTIEEIMDADPDRDELRAISDLGIGESIDLRVDGTPTPLFRVTRIA
jgi:hypothetical protein